MQGEFEGILRHPSSCNSSLRSYFQHCLSSFPEDSVQLKVLQEHFEESIYCDRRKLEYLSKLLNPSQRVIHVWFQNARQKSRKLKQKQTSVERSLSHPQYECKNCLEVFQTYLDLIIHQIQPCQKEEEEKERIKTGVTPLTPGQGQEQYQPSRGSTDSDTGRHQRSIDVRLDCRDQALV